MEGQRSLNARIVERDFMDSVGHGATPLPIKTHRKEDGKVTEKETVREPRKGENCQSRKRRTPSQKEKVQERKDNVSTKSQNHHKSSGQVDLGNNGQNDFGMLRQTLRVGGTTIGTQQIRILRPQRQLRNFNMRLTVIFDSRIWVLSDTLNLFNMTDWIFHSELSRLVWILLHVKLLFLPITLQHVDNWSTKTPYLDVRTAPQAETKCMTKEKGSCAPWMEQESQWPSRAEKSTAAVP